MLSVMLITCAYYASKVNLLCSKNYDGKYSKIIKESKFYKVIKEKGTIRIAESET